MRKEITEKWLDLWKFRSLSSWIRNAYMAWLRGIFKRATREDSLPIGLEEVSCHIVRGLYSKEPWTASRNSELTAATMKTRLQLCNGKTSILPSTVWAWNGISSSMKEHRLTDIFIIVFTKNGVAYKFVTLLNVSLGYNVREAVLKYWCQFTGCHWIHHSLLLVSAFLSSQWGGGITWSPRICQLWQFYEILLCAIRWQSPWKSVIPLYFCRGSISFDTRFSFHFKVDWILYWNFSLFTRYNYKRVQMIHSQKQCIHLD